MEDNQGNNEPVFIRQNGRNQGSEGYPLSCREPDCMWLARLIPPMTNTTSGYFQPSARPLDSPVVTHNAAQQ